MADPLNAVCPICDAQPGETCWGARGKPRATYHRDRGNVPQRERRPYDVEPEPVPALFQLDPPPEPHREEHGRVRVELNPRTCAVGLAGIDNARAVLAEGRYRRTYATAIEHGCSHAEAERRARDAAGWPT